jgi:hypothetical protein
LLADRDFEGRKLYRLYAHISEQICLIFLSTLRVLSKLVDEYVRIEDSSGNCIIVYADGGNLYVPTCTNINSTYICTNNFSNFYKNLPVVLDYLSRNLTAFLTTDLILRPTSRRIDCNDKKSRYFFLHSSNLLIHLTGSVIILGRRDDVLWQSLDASNVMLAQANSIKHYHGTLDGLDVLAMLLEYTTFDEMGVSFTALDKEADPMTPQSWWSTHKWYFYGMALAIILLVFLIGMTWLCSCSNGCLLKFCCTPCRVLCKKHIKRRNKRRLTKPANEIAKQNIDTLSNALLLRSLQAPLSVTTTEPAVRFEPTLTSSSKLTPSFAVRYVPVTDKDTSNP